MFCYIGPGGALSALGSLLALGLALVFAVLGFVWYPIKRLLRALRREPPPPQTPRTQTQPADRRSPPS